MTALRRFGDVGVSAAWYQDVLGLKKLYRFEKLVFFDCGGIRLMLKESDKPRAEESIIYLRVDDIQEAHRHLLDNGVDVIAAPHLVHRHEDGAEEWMAFFKDPDGRPLAIMTTVPANRS